MADITVGRVVHYVLPEGKSAGETRAAIVTRVWSQMDDALHPGTVNLQILIDGPNDAGLRDWVGTVFYSEAPKAGAWSWPARN